ncbi:cytochrome P450 [Rickenella mellea]|uniref:Cytochrome P450 n=1 Tax=Rickenella mellea TaxID=50990 RepID=A0A4Y7QGR4_9AGAM|nr:cytochrome P450 [Rickenella mellea]
MFASVQYVVPLVVVVLLYVRYLNSRARPHAPLPPGPKGVMLVGNINDIPPKRQWLKFAEWKSEYGDVTRLTLLQRPFLVLNSRAAIEALLVKKSQIYSDRPSMTLLKEWAGWTWSLPGLEYGPEMNLHRRLLNSGLSPSACRDYYLDLQLAALRLARKVGADPSVWAASVHTMVAGNILKMTYGYNVQEKNDPWMARAEKILELIQDLGTLGSHPVDIFPWLANLPPRVFGAKLADNLTELRRMLNSVLNEPYAEVKDALDKGIDRPCFTTSMITAHKSKEDGKVEDEYAIKSTAATNYTVGVETVESTLRTFGIAMMLNPSVQARAQAELDAYLDGQRLPTLHDREKLPYVEAVMMEVLRWQPSTPLAIARRTMEDDVYNGLWIEKDAILLANSWQCLHDPDDYPSPHDFIPDRYIPSSPFNPNPAVSPPDPRDFAFGYGRRACPGRTFAESSLFITIATLLSVCSFELPLNEDGVEIKPDMEYESGVAVTFPKPYKCGMKFRSDAARELLDATLSDLDV